jgi:hypothetical protein
MSSKYFWNSTLHGLNRIGDVFIPQDGEMPSFSQFGGIEAIDTVIAYLPAGDVTLLNLVLTIFAVMPTGFLRWIVREMENSLEKTGEIPSVLRQLNLGLRGIIFSCYYSGVGAAGFRGHNPLEVLGYELNRVEN